MLDINYQTKPRTFLHFNDEEILERIMQKIHIAKTLHSVHLNAAEAALYVLRQGHSMDLKQIIIDQNWEFYTISASLLLNLDQMDLHKKRSFIITLSNVLNLYSDDELIGLYEKSKAGTVGDVTGKEKNWLNIIKKKPTYRKYLYETRGAA